MEAARPSSPQRPPAGGGAAGDDSDGDARRRRSQGRGKGGDDDEDNDDDDGDDSRRHKGGASGRGGGERDYAAERQAELHTMRAEAKNKTYGRVKTDEQVWVWVWVACHHRDALLCIREHLIAGGSSNSEGYCAGLAH